MRIPTAQPGHLGGQELLPETVAGERFYTPDDAEAALAERLREIARDGTRAGARVTREPEQR